MKCPNTPWNFGFVSLTSSKEKLNIDKSPEPPEFSFDLPLLETVGYDYVDTGFPILFDLTSDPTDNPKADYRLRLTPECLEDNDSHRPIIHKLTSSRHEKSSAGLWLLSGVGVIGRHGFQPSASPFRPYRREIFEKRMDLKVGKLAAAGVHGMHRKLKLRCVQLVGIGGLANRLCV